MNKKSFLFVTLYTLLLWILTIFITTIIILLIELFIQGKQIYWNNQIGYFIYSLVFSLPTYILLGLIIKFITRNKLVLVIIAFLLSFLFIYVYGLNFDLSNPEDYILPGVHSIVLSCLILVSRLNIS
ncbi:ABC-type transport system involved in multi-copper enzyme maturation permease subunit [Chryseobacterium sp. BIGb0232]|nr:ABC-type transport system involved in multi-copper enzyme maturation permease subunit [Chryseobacterium sp. BIGb0232]ROS17537.1 hypothetical protein EDF65_1909 [Chryseobacterium nakagawai]